jgi:hypothetical protein
MLAVAVSVFLGFWGPGWAAEPTSFLEQMSKEERDRRDALEAERLQLQPFTLEYGGWYRFSFFSFNEPGSAGVPSNNVSLRNNDLRFWMSANLEDIHYVYTRFRVGFIDFSQGDSFDRNDKDTDGPNLDMAYYRLDITRALKKYYGVLSPVSVQLQAGRQYFNVGTGLVYSDIADGVQMFVGAPLWKVNLFASQTIRSEDDVDRSIPNPDHSYRNFAGAQFNWTGIDQHEPYVFWVAQRSHNPDEDVFQNYEYDSDYVGVGSHGQLVLPGLRYYSEFVWEWGESSPSGVPSGLDPIDAYALDAGLDYYFDCHTKPRVGVEYALGSGDNDRLSPTNTIGGNRPGTNDENFLYFGFINTGDALAVRLSNLQFLRVGGSLRPFEGSPCLDHLELGANLFHYWKDAAGGGISDFRADRANEDVGTELDIFLHWQVLSDLAFGVRFGTFFPGDAYTHETERNFLATSVTYSF